MKMHRIFIHNEKYSYYGRRLQAIYHPDKYLSCILDAATQAVMNLPHFVETDHITSECKGVLCIPWHVYVMAEVHIVMLLRTISNMVLM